MKVFSHAPAPSRPARSTRAAPGVPPLPSEHTSGARFVCTRIRAPLRAWRVLVTTAVALPLLLALPAGAQTPQPHRDGRSEVTLALAGDAIITRRLSVYTEPEFLALRDLVRGATAAFVNLEMLFHEFGPEIIPATESGGTYMQADPALADELVWMGFDMVSMANNHTGDYGIGGMRSTIRAVEAAGLMHAGTGENLALARAPGYLETGAARVALISAASTFPDASRAGHQRKDVRGRPGLSPLRFETIYQVTPAQMEALRAFRGGMRGGRVAEAVTEEAPPPQPGERLRLFGQTFEVGEEYRTVTTPHQGDLEELLASVREADRQADLVIFSSHSHESAGSRGIPADFLVTAAHAVIDAGADIFLAHGPHVLRGIEVYNGGIIFYSLGDFLFQNETVPFQPADNYERYDLGPEAVASDFFDARQRTGGFPANPLIWESVVATVTFREGRLTEVQLHPITLGHGLPRPQRGRPLLATGALGAKILGDLQRLSEPFGTEIETRDGVGRVVIR